MLFPTRFRSPSLFGSLSLPLFQLASLCLFLTSNAVGAPCSSAQGNLPNRPDVVRLSTTTSTEQSGLLGAILPAFEAASGLHVQVIAVGSGKALELARNGDVDVTLVHARASEDRFIQDGWGIQRHDVAYNDFVLVGPASDPAEIRGQRDVLDALRQLIFRQARFISRGDNSGTDQMEQSYWRALGEKPQGKAYVSAGLGMGEVLMLTAELKGYTLTDRATWVSYRAKTGLEVLVQGDPRLFNPYGIIAVSPARHSGINCPGAVQLIDWITGADGQRRIADFRVDGKPVFFLHAKP